jgi:exosortase A-associated hydrolase 2
MEEAFFFENQGDKLFCMIHFPPLQRRNANSCARVGFIFCHPFADEAFRTHRELVVYARRLAKDGFVVLRFDYRGCGDSSGDFENYTLESRISDIKRAMDVLKEKSGVESVGLLGLRFGGTLAATVATQDERVNHLILWAPIVDSARYFQFLQQSQMAHELGNFGRVISSRRAIAESLANGGTFDLMANIISQQVYQELLSFDPWSTQTRCPEHVLIVGIEGDTTKPADLKRLKERYPASEFIMIKEKLFWFDKVYQAPMNLYETTSQWLRLLSTPVRR